MRTFLRILACLAAWYSYLTKYINSHLSFHLNVLFFLISYIQHDRWMYLYSYLQCGRLDATVSERASCTRASVSSAVHFIVVARCFLALFTSTNHSFIYFLNRACDAILNIEAFTQRTKRKSVSQGLYRSIGTASVNRCIFSRSELASQFFLVERCLLYVPCKLFKNGELIRASSSRRCWYCRW